VPDHFVKVSDGTRTRDRLDHNEGVAPCGLRVQSRLGAGFVRIGRDSAVVDIPIPAGFGRAAPSGSRQPVKWRGVAAYLI
jgi:hypothetical protein